MPQADISFAGLDSRKLAQALPAHLRAGLQVLESVDSTQDALLAVAADSPDRSLCLSTHQRRGRGRRGRDWLSPPGASLALSMLARHPAGNRWQPSLSLALGVAAAQVLQELGVTGIGLKWPNDLLVADRKLGGILLETWTGGVVAGIGINLALPESLRQTLDQPCDDLAELGVSIPAETLAARLAMAWDQALDRFAQTGLSAFHADWEQLDVLAGKTVQIRNEAENDLVGQAEGIDAHGRLQVEIAGRLQTFTSADVSVRRL